MHATHNTQMGMISYTHMNKRFSLTKKETKGVVKNDKENIIVCVFTSSRIYYSLYGYYEK